MLEIIVLALGVVLSALGAILIFVDVAYLVLVMEHGSDARDILTWVICILLTIGAFVVAQWCFKI